MTTDDQNMTIVRLTARVIREQEDVLTVRLDDGFSNQQVAIHRKNVTSDTPADAHDAVRLPGLLAAAITKRLREHGPHQREWLQQNPNELLERLDEETAAMRSAIKRDGSRVLACAADVALAALMLADKADKLEPMPEMIDVE